MNPNLEDLLDDPFSEPTQNHELIGVANLCLGSLFHAVRFQYWVPVISPQGEIAGKLEVISNIFLLKTTVVFSALEKCTENGIYQPGGVLWEGILGDLEK